MQLKLLFMFVCFCGYGGYAADNAKTVSPPDHKSNKEKDSQPVVASIAPKKDDAPKPEVKNSLEDSSFKEINQIIESGKLRVAMYHLDVKPFYFKESDTPDAKLIGVDADLAGIIANAIGNNVKVEFVRTAKSIDEIITQVKNGEADIAISKLSYSIDRARSVLYSSKPYLTLNVCFLMNRSYVSQESLEQIFSKPENKLCAVSGSAQFKLAKELFPKSTILAAQSADELEKFLTEKKCIAYIRDDNEIKKALIKNPTLNLHYQPIVVKGKKDDIFIVVDPKKPNLVTFINKLMEQRSEFKTDLDAIFQKYGSYLK
jgi:polar amino acid transport system substrate-binding protein